MNLLINANDDTLIIEDGNINGDITKFDLKKRRVSPYELKNILEEIINRIIPTMHDSGSYLLNTSLEYIDEDTHKTIGEW